MNENKHILAVTLPPLFQSYHFPAPSKTSQPNSLEIFGMEGGGEVIPDGCVTPKNPESQIPTALICPPPPKKVMAGFGKGRDPPKNGYFQPPDLESLFALPPRREALGCCR
ncbi:cyclin-dependent protein kinase inhibitor SMR4 [Cinnamomum micranthum f. kanehirae]|uniref:Cyclin-dependent protein kinase inhibitor SMR4 n=1 Tax=Cinnamomum micranthum f. kanehirae TaxID=337451 RepID=A0A443NSW2_9MAGN|nr:cyclin-dependent protein kinase inhibitor SMR4 [Cinnamomum micranthum f. kanehirae]